MMQETFKYLTRMSSASGLDNMQQPKKLRTIAYLSVDKVPKVSLSEVARSLQFPSPGRQQ